MNLLGIVVYSALKKDFFGLLFSINCTAGEYVGCTDVKRHFDIEGAEGEELVDIGLGVRVSRPVVVDRGLKGGCFMFSSLSHRGTLAVGFHTSGYRCQLTDLVDGRQTEIRVEDATHTGFYDDSMVVLTYGKLLGVCSVEEMFLNEDVGVLKRVGDVEVDPRADVSLLHSTRVLLFTTMAHAPHEFDVDTGVMRRLGIGKVSTFASLTGIDVGVRGVFRENGNRGFTYSLNNDNTLSLVLRRDHSNLCMFIPSSATPGDLRRGAKTYHNGGFFTSTRGKAHLATPFRYQVYQSVVRLYQDIFLVFDAGTGKWCLVRMLVP